MKRLSGCYAALCLCLGAVAAPSFDANRLPDSFTVESGDYSMTVEKAPAFTIRSLIYRGTPVLIPSGWMQPVLNVGGQGEEQWIGTGHGREEVTSLELTQDGAVIPLGSARRHYGGQVGGVMRLVKDSVMGPYSHRSVLELSPEGLRQSYYFEVIGDASVAKFLYAFMLIFPKEAEFYRLVLADGRVAEDVLPASDTHQSLAGHAGVSSLSMLFARSGVVATFVPDEAYRTRRNQGNFFVVRRRDNKFYTQVVPPKRPGAKFEYHLTLRCAEATAQSFPDVADGLVKQIVADRSAKRGE